MVWWGVIGHPKTEKPSRGEKGQVHAGAHVRNTPSPEVGLEFGNREVDTPLKLLGLTNPKLDPDFLKDQPLRMDSHGPDWKSLCVPLSGFVQRLVIASRRELLSLHGALSGLYGAVGVEAGSGSLHLGRPVRGHKSCRSGI